MGRFLAVGKLKPQLLRDLLSRHGIRSPKLAVGPKSGEDAAAIDMGDHYLLLAADPITFTPRRLGWYAVHVNANDIAAMGGTPRYFLSTVLLPEQGATAEMAERIFADVGDACRELGCLPVGGHTEVTAGLTRPLLAGAMVGDVSRDGLVTSSGARPGDMLVLARGIAIEATAILARERADEVTDAFGAAFQDKAARFLEDPGLSVVEAGRAACATGALHALHDPTEGGIANGLWELAEASEVGLVVSETEIPRYWESTQLAQLFGIDLLGAIASGSLLMSCAEADTSRVLESVSAPGIEANVIGRVVERKQGVKMLRGQKKVALPRFDADELTRVL
ncbi:MAG: AIR synthase family protein [Acidobacteriota bacterium]